MTGVIDGVRSTATNTTFTVGLVRRASEAPSMFIFTPTIPRMTSRQERSLPRHGKPGQRACRGPRVSRCEWRQTPLPDCAVEPTVEDISRKSSTRMESPSPATWKMPRLPGRDTSNFRNPHGCPIRPRPIFLMARGWQPLTPRGFLRANRHSRCRGPRLSRLQRNRPSDCFALDHARGARATLETAKHNCQVVYNSPTTGTLRTSTITPG